MQAAVGFEKNRIVANQRLLKDRLAENMVSGPDAIKHKDGYIFIGKQAYGTKEALGKAKQDIEYFEAYGEHMPPLPYPTTPHLAGRYYPDVTKKVDSYLKEIRREIKQVSKSRLNSYPWFKQNFGNNTHRDLQVNHGLPGQVLNEGDQYAIYKAHIRRAGYISNYAFGFATAAAGYFDLEAFLLAQGAAIVGDNDGDSKEDLKAIQKGWKDYWEKYPNEKKPSAIYTD